MEEEELIGPEEGEEQDASEERPSQENPATAPTGGSFYSGLTVKDSRELRKDWYERGLITKKDWEEWLHNDGPDPLFAALRRRCEARDRDLRREERRE